MTLLLEKWEQCLTTPDRELWTDHTDGTTRVLHAEPVIWGEVAYRYMNKSQTTTSPTRSISWALSDRHSIGQMEKSSHLKLYCLYDPGEGGAS